MVGYMSLEEQVDADFSRARRTAFLRRLSARLRKGPTSSSLLCFEEVRRMLGAAGGVRRGRRTVRLADIVGSVGRCSEFDRGFMPAKASAKERWKRIDRAFYQGEELPPVELYRIGDAYFVLDGNHRVSVARFHGVEWIDAEVTEFGAAAPWSYPRDRQTLGERSRGEDLRRHEMWDFELAKQRREELLREAERNRLTKELRAGRKRRSGRRSALVWEIRRCAGRFLKLFRLL